MTIWSASSEVWPFCKTGRTPVLTVVGCDGAGGVLGVAGRSTKRTATRLPVMACAASVN